MKVGGTRRADQVGISRPAGSTSGAQPGFEPAAGDAPRAAGLRGASGLSGVDALLALQAAPSVPADGRNRRQAIRQGEDILDLLDDIKLGLLAGTIPKGKLKALVAAVEGQRLAVMDPRLAEVLDHIELRARVEIAKYRDLL